MPFPWRAVALACLWLPAGCYRSASFEPDEVQRIVPQAEQKLLVQQPDGSRRVFDGYDTVEIEAVEDSGYEFERPVSAELQPGVLVVSDAYSRRSFRQEEVEGVTVWEHAPERPWIIAGATLGASILFGFIGYSLPGDCSHPEDSCEAKAYLGMFGATVGLGLGLGLSIPLSGKLRPEPIVPPSAPFRR